MPASAKVQELIDRRASLISRLDPEIIYDTRVLLTYSMERQIVITARLGAFCNRTSVLVSLLETSADKHEIERARTQARVNLLHDVFRAEGCTLQHIEKAEGL